MAPDDVQKSKTRNARAQAENQLRQAALDRTPITYGALAEKITYIDVQPYSLAMNRLLEDISRSSHKRDGILLSAVVVRSTKAIPGPGFFDLARTLDFEFADDEEFWSDHVERVYAIYSSLT